MKYSEFFKFIEKKDHIINRLDLTGDQKQEAIDFFNKHQNYENEIDWNRKDISWEDIEEVIYKERLSGTQLKNFVKKDKHFLVLYSDENCVIFQPLTWLGSRYLASTDVKPKVEGKWCTAYQKDRKYWDDYSINFGKSFIYICTNTTKWALEIGINDVDYWNVHDIRTLKRNFLLEISQEVPNILELLTEYIPVARENYTLVKEYHEIDLQESEALKRSKEEAKKLRIRLFPKSFKRQVRRKGYYEWGGNISYTDLKKLGLIKENKEIDERFKYFKISGKINFKNSPIKSITIPSKLTHISDCAFKGCTSLKKSTIPNSVVSIEEYAFSYCVALTSITIPGSVKSIGDRAFDSCYSLKKIAISDGVTSIGDGAFYRCESLTSITIPNSVTSISEDAFRYCSSLSKIVLPDSITSIEDYTFSCCTSLTDITIPNSVVSIKEGAFFDCKSLTEITIPNNVTSIEEGAFELCLSLKNIYIDKEKDSLDLSEAGISKDCKIYWRGEF